ncbi:MAG TPA: arginase, partial [Tissierella sp.]|nr:arginase [Tissierella sp.]
LLDEKFITSMDFVELNPKIDNEDGRTIKHCIEMLEHIFKIINS